MDSRKRLGAILSAGAIAFSPVVACYDYVEHRTTAITPGREVQLTLTDSGAVALAQLVGPRVQFVRGRFVADSSGAYILAVNSTQTRDGNDADWHAERLAVPHVLVTSLADRQFSPARTIGLTAGIVAALVAMTEGFHGGTGSPSPTGTGPISGPK